MQKINLTKNVANLKNKAFSIIEISIVILVISVLIGGISATRSLINKARLANAQSLTQKSIINDLSEDLVAWYETSLETSFIATETKNNNSRITLWKDNNKNAVIKNNATAIATVSTQPQLIKNSFYNSIPGLRFSGGQYLNYNGQDLIRSSYTIFVVEQRRNNSSSNYFIGGNPCGSNNCLTFGYRSNTILTQAHWTSDVDITVSAYTSPIPRIHTFLFNNTIGKSYSIDGVVRGTAPAQTGSLIAYSGARIASTTTVFYNGDIAEIIIFKRSLKTDEIKAIENYLGAKYGIPVS